MRKLSFLLIIILAIVLYSLFLNLTPVHFNQDELGFSLNALSISKTGFDENNRYFPLYFWHLDIMWATPIIVYLTALILKFLPLSEIVVRFPSVIVGIMDLVLIYFLARKIFKSHSLGIIAMIVLATTPAHFIQSRILLDNLYVVPFVILWLLSLISFLENENPKYLILSGLALGLGFYSYHAARIMMPFYLITTIITIFPEIKKKKKLLFVLLSGFIAPLLPLVPWTAQYPETLFLDQVKYTGIYDSQRSALNGIMTLLSPESIGHRLDVYISYFSPIHMFLLGDASLIHSTSLYSSQGLTHSVIIAGVFLLSLVIFIPLGIYRVVKLKKVVSKLIIFGFLTAPIAGALAGDHYRFSRILVILPFATILAVYGIQFLLQRKEKLLHLLLYGLVALSILQFTYFLYDYFTSYQARSYNWMKYNIPGALEEVIKEDSTRSAKVIYLDNRIEFIDKYWKFYLTKNGREALLNKTEMIDVRNTDTDNLSPNSIILYFYHDVDGQKEQIGEFKKIETIREPDFVPTFYIFRN